MSVRTPIFNIPHIKMFYTSLLFFIYLINYSKIPQCKLYGKSVTEVVSFTIYHFYIQKSSIYANNTKYVDSNDFFS